MTYKAEVTKKFIENNQIRLTVQFKKGATVIEQDIIISNPSLIRSELIKRVALLEQLDAYILEPLGEVDLTVIPSPVVLPTARETAHFNYSAKLEDLEIAKKQLDLELITKTDYNVIRDATKLLLDIYKGL